MGKKAIVVILLLLVFAFVAGSQKNRLIHRITEATIAKMTGFGVKIAGVETSLKNRSVTLTGLRLMNPAQYNEREACDVFRAYAEAPFKTWLGSDQHFTKLHIVVHRIVLVRNADHTTNMDSLTGELGLPLTESTTQTWFPLAAIGSQADPKQEGLDLTIDELKVHIGQVVFVDYTLGKDNKPMRFTYNVDEERTYFNVSDLKHVVKEMVLSLSVHSISKNLGGLLSSDTIDELVDKAPQWIQELRESMGQGQGRDGKESQNSTGKNPMQDALKSLFQ